MATKKKTVKSKAKKKTSKPSEKLMQTHAMEEKQGFEKTTLDQIWGDTGNSKYGTLKEAEYSSQIKAMNKSDLHSHAIKLGILPVENRDLLTKRLVREFKKHVLSFKKPRSASANKKPSKVSDSAKSILAQGR
jgi:regulatory protein YycH of two-component signal transduction system YycFG